jgi:tetratricopeptide (TPR) repeat protein
MVMKRFTPTSPSVAVLAAVLISMAAAPATFAQQATGAKAGTPAANPLLVLLESAEKDFFEGKYKTASEKYQEALTKYSGRMDDDAKGAVTFRSASCKYFIKDWVGAEAALKEFLEKFPNGTGTFLDPNSNFRGPAQLSLAEAQANQKKFDEAIAGLNVFRLGIDNRFEDKVKALLFIADLTERKAAAGTPAEQKAATLAAVDIVKPVMQNNLALTEVREAAYKLVGLYTKAGMIREATQLRKELEARITNPADLVRANFLKLDLGDRYFKQAESLQGVADSQGITKREELYKSAISAYQGVHRRKYIATFMDKAVIQAEENFNKLKAQHPVADGAAPPEQVKKAEDDFHTLKTIRADFEKNKSYDSILAYRLGLCLVELKRPWEARVAFKDIIDKDPEFEIDNGGVKEAKGDIAYYYYIVCQNEVRRYKEAQEECKKFLAKFPKSPVLGNVAVMLGDISLQQEEYRQAIDNFRWARLNVPGLSPADCEYIDGAIADAFFRNLDWTEARKATENFISNYASSRQIETMRYMRALTFFYETKYKETTAAFDEYANLYPNGIYRADIAYRYALVVLGIRSNDPAILKRNALDVVGRCDRWIKGYAESADPAVINQLPELINLKADAYQKIADMKSGLTKEEQKKYANLALDSYVESAMKSGNNKQVLDFALRELNKTLPARGEWGRLKEIYDHLYKRAPKAPEALSHLYWIIKCTEKMGNTPEERLKSAEEAKIILSDAIVENINDIRQDNVENLVIELAQKLAREVKRRDKLNKDKPGTIEPLDATLELRKLLKLDQNRDSVIAQARGRFAKAEIAKALKNTEDAEKNLDSIAAIYKPDELSPTILAIVGDHLLAKGKIAAAEKFYSYLKENYRGSSFADYGFAGLAEIMLGNGKAKEALALTSDALESGLAYTRVRDLSFLKARALLDTGALDEAKKEFTAIAGVKEWRGETTAGCKYYLGLVEEKKGNFKEAVNNYNACMLLWKKYEKYAMKSTLRAALVFSEKLGQPQAAKETLTKLFKDDNAKLLERYKTTPEWAECEKLLERIK